MPSWLFVPGTMGERRKSEGCIATQFMSNTLHREREQDHEKKVMKPKTSNDMSDVNREVGSSTGRLTFNTSNLDRHLIEVLRENYDIEQLNDSPDPDVIKSIWISLPRPVVSMLATLEIVFS
uniref:Neur_chan_LBD domain-containing protein n=1 Tax=Heterorhabditis bacteriophora TaxID=37862 RepID=A0A1I7WN89_HETBA